MPHVTVTTDSGRWITGAAGHAMSISLKEDSK